MKKNRFHLLFIILVITLPVYAKSGADHSWDMLNVLGLRSFSDISTSNYNKSQLQSLFTKINDYIDTLNLQGYEGVTDNFYDKLQKDFNFKFEKIYTHRELYHWGFDFDIDLTPEGIPSDNQIPEKLKVTFSQNFRNTYGDANWMIFEWHRFLKALKEEQAKRNNSLIQEVKKSLGLKSSVDARDIAAILYYTHLLGDHIVHEGEKSAEAILEMRKIEKNIDAHMKSLSRNNKWFYNDYKNAIISINKQNDITYAENLLQQLTIHLPKLLKFRFFNEFNSKNLRFIFEEDLLKTS